MSAIINFDIHETLDRPFQIMTIMKLLVLPLIIAGPALLSNFEYSFARSDDSPGRFNSAHQEDDLESRMGNYDFVRCRLGKNWRAARYS